MWSKKYTAETNVLLGNLSNYSVKRYLLQPAAKNSFIFIDLICKVCYILVGPYTKIIESLFRDVLIVVLQNKNGLVSV